MKTDSKIAAIFLSTAIWADENYSDTEREALQEIAANLKLDTLADDVQACITEVTNLSADELAKKLTKAAKKVDSEEKDGILALCLQLMGCDSYLAKEEINNFFVLAGILGIDTEHAKGILTELVEEKKM